MLKVAALFILLQNVLASIEDVWIAPANDSQTIFFDGATSGGLKQTFPGLKLRVA